MTSFEQAYFPKTRERDVIRRRHDLRNLFAGELGQRVLADLCAVCHPLDHSIIPDALTAAHVRGRQEIIAMLWRYGSDSPGFPDPSPTHPQPE